MIDRKCQMRCYVGTIHVIIASVLFMNFIITLPYPVLPLGLDGGE